ncbi:MAG: hypothetical protein DMF68_14880 [Acidobacteria bacterium]|nr:MAG: hypothetical protein DMF68_14880 [Acidobacteriota bacterium]
MMASLHNLSDNLLEADDFETKSGRSSLVKVVSILAAILITGGLLTGFLIWRKKHEEQLAVTQAAQTKAARPALPAKVQVFMDDAIRKGPQVTISGTVQNISNEKLSNVKLQSEEVGFKPAQGAKRPVEHPPETKTIIVDRPSSPKQGEEFINTPDNPSKVP